MKFIKANKSWMNRRYTFKETSFYFYGLLVNFSIDVYNNGLLIGSFTNIKLKPKKQ